MSHNNLHNSNSPMSPNRPTTSYFSSPYEKHETTDLIPLLLNDLLTNTLPPRPTRPNPWLGEKYPSLKHDLSSLGTATCYILHQTTMGLWVVIWVSEVNYRVPTNAEAKRSGIALFIQWNAAPTRKPSADERRRNQNEMSPEHNSALPRERVPATVTVFTINFLTTE